MLENQTQDGDPLFYPLFLEEIAPSKILLENSTF